MCFLGSRSEHTSTTHRHTSCFRVNLPTQTQCQMMRFTHIEFKKSDHIHYLDLTNRSKSYKGDMAKRKQCFPLYYLFNFLVQKHETWSGFCLQMINLSTSNNIHVFILASASETTKPYLQLSMF